MTEKPDWMGETEWALHQAKEALHGVDERDLTFEEEQILSGVFWTLQSLRNDVMRRND